MASAEAVEPEEPDYLSQMVQQQIAQLQGTLQSTIALATSQGCGVRVDWALHPTEESMAENNHKIVVAMQPDPSVEVGQVVFNTPSPEVVSP